MKAILFIFVLSFGTLAVAQTADSIRTDNKERLEQKKKLIAQQIHQKASELDTLVRSAQKIGLDVLISVWPPDRPFEMPVIHEPKVKATVREVKEVQY